MRNIAIVSSLILATVSISTETRVSAATPARDDPTPFDDAVVARIDTASDFAIYWRSLRPHRQLVDELVQTAMRQLSPTQLTQLNFFGLSWEQSLDAIIDGHVDGIEADIRATGEHVRSLSAPVEPESLKKSILAKLDVNLRESRRQIQMLRSHQRAVKFWGRLAASTTRSYHSARRGR